MENILEKKEIYTSGQIIIASCFGGPISLLYTVTSNIASFGNKKLAKYILILGTILIITGIFYLYYEAPSSKSVSKAIASTTLFISICFSVNEYKSKVRKYIENGGKEYNSSNIAKVILIGALLVIGTVLLALTIRGTPTLE